MGGIFDGKTQNCANGVYALTAIDVFKMLDLSKYRSQKLSVSCSFFEIYGSKVRIIHIFLTYLILLFINFFRFLIFWAKKQNYEY